MPSSRSTFRSSGRLLRLKVSENFLVLWKMCWWLSSVLLDLPLVKEAVSTINACVETGRKTNLLRALQSEDAQLKGVAPENIQWYSDILSKTKRDAEEVSEVGCPPVWRGRVYVCLSVSQCGEGGELSKQEIQDIILMANQIAEHTRLGKA